MRIIILLVTLGTLALWAVVAAIQGLRSDGYGRPEVSRRNIRSDDLPR